jgi:antitoxin (DNA-binding transcriptional repressor) of toxin-antitoxin stability system
MPDHTAPYAALGTHVLDVTELLAAAGGVGERAIEQLVDAIDGASDQGQFTWLTNAGRPVAAIVPVDAAEDVLARLGRVLAHVAGTHDPDRGPACPECGRKPCKMDCSRR